MFGKKSAGIPPSGGSLFGSTTVSWETQYKEGNSMWKVPRLIRLNDNIVVREDETAIFMRDGKILSTFEQPGRYALTDINAPLVGPLVKALSGVQQQAEAYYLQRRYMDGKFGSQEPYQFTDPTFGVVNLRVFGEYRWKISDVNIFVSQFIGTFNVETSDEVEQRLREQIVILVYNALGKMKEQGLKVTDLPSNLTTIEQVVITTSQDHFRQFGVEINKIQQLNISLPEEVQKAVDTRSEMSVLGVNYIQYQAGQAMVDASKNQSGVAGIGAGLGVGLGAGAGMGYAFSNQMTGMQQQQGRNCPKCGTLVPQTSNFCPNCGFNMAQQQTSMVKCPSCGTEMPAGSKFCPNCGNSMAPKQPQALKCPKCGTDVDQGVKFCPNCGNKM